MTSHRRNDPPGDLTRSGLRDASSFRRRGVLCVRLQSFSLQSQADIGRFGRELSALVENNSDRTLVIDFDKVQLLPSAVVGELAAQSRKMSARGGHIRLATINPQIREVLVVSGLYKLFEFYDDLPSATRGKKKKWWRWWGS